MSRVPYSPLHLRDSDSISIESQSSLSTNATAPNLVGAGRTLGLLIDKAGGWLQRRMNLRATRRGYGPQETADAVTKIVEGTMEERELPWYCDKVICVRRSLTDAEKKAAEKKCKRLVKYTR